MKSLNKNIQSVNLTAGKCFSCEISTLKYTGSLKKVNTLCAKPIRIQNIPPKPGSNITSESGTHEDADGSGIHWTVFFY